MRSCDSMLGLKESARLKKSVSRKRDVAGKCATTRFCRRKKIERSHSARVTVICFGRIFRSVLGRGRRRQRAGARQSVDIGLLRARTDGERDECQRKNRNK